MTPSISDLVRDPAFWFSAVFVGLLVNVAASYVFNYLNSVQVGKAILTVMTIVHAVLTGLSWLLIAAIKSSSEPITAVGLVLIAAGSPMIILWLARQSNVTATAQLLTFIAIFGLLLIMWKESWLDILPVYGVLAIPACLLVLVYVEAHRFLVGRPD